MKKILAASLLALAAATAHADVLSYMENNAGGLIEFTDAACPTTGAKVMNYTGWMAFDTASDGTILETGCWEVQEPNIMVRWSDGTFKAYRDVVTMTEYGKRVAKRSQK
jgi:hypothetical protein